MGYHSVIVIMLEYLPLSVRGTASGSCANLTYFSTQLELMLAEYERQEPPPGAVRVRAALDVQHATIDDNAATVTLLAAMHLVSRFPKQTRKHPFCTSPKLQILYAKSQARLL